MSRIRQSLKRLSGLRLRRAIEQPASGYVRIACGEPCEVVIDDTRREGTIWNLSVLGVFVVLEPPLPAIDQPALLTFTLPGDPRPITCQARVRWQNLPSIFKGCGEPARTLPPGCGFEFVMLDPSDAARVGARVDGKNAPA